MYSKISFGMILLNKMSPEDILQFAYVTAVSNTCLNAGACMLGEECPINQGAGKRAAVLEGLAVMLGGCNKYN